MTFGALRCSDDTGSPQDSAVADSSRTDVLKGDGPGAKSEGGGSKDTIKADTFNHQGKVKCGPLVCTLPAKVCCAKLPSAGGKGPQCTSPAACMMASALACDGPEDCSKGNVCCGASTAGVDAILALCNATCPAPNGKVLCHSLSDCPSGFKNCCTKHVSGGTLPIKYCATGGCS